MPFSPFVIFLLKLRWANEVLSPPLHHICFWELCQTIQCMDFLFSVNERVVKTLETNCSFTLVQLKMLEQPDTKPSPHEDIINDRNLKIHFEALKLSLQPTDCLLAQIYPISRNWRKSCGDYYLRLHNNNTFEVHVLLGPAKPKFNTTRNKCSHKAYEHHSQSGKTMAYGSDKLPWLPHWLHPLPTVSWV